MSELEIDPQEIAAFAATLDVHTVATELLMLKKRLELSADAPNDRTGALVAILANIEFICSALGFASLPAPLSKLQMALADLDEGIVAPLLTPASRDGRPPASSEWRLSVKANSAIAMQLLMWSGKRENFAARLVGEKLRQLGVPLGQTETPPGGTVKAWRKQVKAGDKSVDADTIAYYEITKRLKGHKLSQQQLLDFLAEQISQAKSTP